MKISTKGRYAMRLMLDLLTTVKTYIAAHRDLVPAKRRHAAPQGCRGLRFRTAPGEAYQMDWGFVAVERPGGERARIACFAMAVSYTHLVIVVNVEA